MPHLLMIARSFHANGPGKIILSLLRAWRQDDVKVTLLALSPEGALHDQIAAEITRLGGEILVERAGMLSAARVGQGLARRQELAGVDVLMAHLLVPDAVGRALSTALGKPLIVVEHGIHGWREKGSLLRPFVRHWYVSTLPQRCIVAAISEKVERDLLAEGFPRNQLVCIPNGVELMDLVDTPRLENCLNVGVVGNLISEKRPELAVEAVAFARSAGLNVELTFVGEGPLLSTIRGFAAQLGVPSHFPGRLADPREAYSRMTAQLHPSRQESFGLAALEGLSAGLPVIAAAESGLADLLPPRPSAWLVGDNRALSWGCSLIDALQVPVQPQIARRRWVAERYGIDKMAQGYLALTHRMLRASVGTPT